jgi:hypothetical protein
MDESKNLIDRVFDQGSGLTDVDANPSKLDSRLSLRSTTTAKISPSAQAADEYLDIARTGLRVMFSATRSSYPQTARGGSATSSSAASPALTMESDSVRYTAIAALGIARLSRSGQRNILAGVEAADLVAPVLARALAGTDPGAVALATWLAAELEMPEQAAQGVDKIKDLVRAAAPIPTVDQAWMLTALVEHGLSADLHLVAAELADRLIRHQAPGGIFPHVLPPESQSRLRAHVGCFADQVYPIQALARYAAAADAPRAMTAANRCATRICELQGPAGQWWWHYDARTSDVIEGYPVYSVHQHAMAPMALFDLLEAGGADHLSAVARGLDWIAQHPEVPEPLIAPDLGVIWRKVGRREPSKAMRKLRAVTTSIRPGLRFGALDVAFPPTRIDRECRPYELGWLLYAWSRTPRQ